MEGRPPNQAAKDSRPAGVQNLPRNYVVVISLKILNMVILERMTTKEKLRENQAGYCKDRFCTDNLATLRTRIEQLLKWNSSVYLTFTDYRKDYRGTTDYRKDNRLRESI